jgi:hypothetical protein
MGRKNRRSKRGMNRRSKRTKMNRRSKRSKMNRRSKRTKMNRRSKRTKMNRRSKRSNQIGGSHELIVKLTNGSKVPVDVYYEDILLGSEPDYQGRRPPSIAEAKAAPPKDRRWVKVSTLEPNQKIYMGDGTFRPDQAWGWFWRVQVGEKQIDWTLPLKTGFQTYTVYIDPSGEPLLDEKHVWQAPPEDGGPVLSDEERGAISQDY